MSEPRMAKWRNLYESIMLPEEIGSLDSNERETLEQFYHAHRNSIDPDWWIEFSHLIQMSEDGAPNIEVFDALEHGTMEGLIDHDVAIDLCHQILHVKPRSSGPEKIEYTGPTRFNKFRGTNEPADVEPNL